MSCYSHMRYLARKGGMRWHESIADYVRLVIERISRRRVVWGAEVYDLADRLAHRYSGAPWKTRDAVAQDVVCAVRGRLTYAPTRWEMQPERAWEEGRQCIALHRERCDCGRTARRSEWGTATCQRCRRLDLRVARLQDERRGIVRLTNKLLKAAKEARESLCAA